MFIHHPLKFGKFLLKIGGEIIFQTGPLHTLFSQLNHSTYKMRVATGEGEPKNKGKTTKEKIGCWRIVHWGM